MKNIMLLGSKMTSTRKHVFLFTFLWIFLSPVWLSAVTLNVTSYGVTGNGTTDDSAAFQTALDAAASQSATLSIPADFTIRITKNLFVHGTCNITGAGDSSIIMCDDDLDNDHGRQYWISVGLSGHKDDGGVQDAFHGTISDLSLKASSNAKFQRCIFIFNTTSATICDVFFDFREGISEGTDAFLFGPTSSGNNGNWELWGAKTIENITLTRNTVIANHSYIDSEGLTVSGAENVVISNNFIFGTGDDPIACHFSEGVEIKDNYCYSIDGRILANCSTDVLIENNYSERIAEYGTTWRSSMSMVYVGLEGNYERNAPTDIIIRNNVLVIPSESPACSYGIRLMGARNTTVEGNILQVDSSSACSGICVEPDTQYPGWTDPAGVDNDGIARPRNVTIKNNIMTGAYPAKILQNSSSNSYLPGPYYIENNVAGRYYWYANAYFKNSNIVFGGDYSNGCAWLAATDDPVTHYEDNLADVVPSTTSNGTTVTAVTSGRVSGYGVLLGSTITAGSITLKLYKNSSEVSSKTVTANGTVYLNGADVNFAFEPGDTLQLKATGSSNLSPSSGIDLDVDIKGIASTIAASYSLEEGSGSSTVDLSGNVNDGTINGASWCAGVNGKALSFDGDDYVTVDDHDSLDISDNLTISFWMNVADYTTGYAGYPISKWTNSTDANFACYYFGTTAGIHQGKIGFLAQAGGTWKVIAPYTTIAQNKWIHVALSYNSVDGGQLYLNGVATGSRAGGGVLTLNSADLVIGKLINGKMDEVKVYNRELSATEIGFLYNNVNHGQLAGHWKFNDDSGSTATDSSVNEFDGTITGASWSSGVEDGALIFDGDDYVTVDDHDSLDISDNLTISFWIYATDYTTGYAGYPISKWTDSTDANFACYYFGTTAGIHQGKIGFLAKAGGTWKVIAPYTTIAQNKWIHVALSYNSVDGGQLYLNGVATGSRAGGGVLTLNSVDLVIGKLIKGKMDEVRIYNRELSSTEIKGLYYMHK